jgi:acetyltransferase-like isoleucine patch superfamily enzyme
MIVNFFKKKAKYFILKYKFPGAYIHPSSVVSVDSILSKGVKVLKSASLGNCKVEKFTYVGINSSFSNTTIGSYCSIGPDVICGLGTHPTDFVSTYPGFYSKKASGSHWFGLTHDFKEQYQTTIGQDVWIGARVIIRGGINIGNGAIIGAGAVVTKDVPPYAIVGGVPASVLKYRFNEDIIQSLIKSKWWEKDEKLLSDLAQHMNDPVSFLKQLEIADYE